MALYYRAQIFSIGFIKGLMSSFPVIPSQVTTLLTPYPHGTITTVETSDALDALVKRTNFMIVRVYVFLDLSTRERLCQRRYFNHTFDQSHSPKDTFACVRFLLYLAAQLLLRFFYLLLLAFYVRRFFSIDSLLL